MVQVNVQAMVALSHLYLQLMLERQAGAVLNVGSVAGFQAVPYFTIYAATKAFVLSFSEALWEECRGRGVRVLALCPGATATHFQQVAGTASRVSPEHLKTPEEVVDAALRALARGRSHVVPGFRDRVQTQIERFIPRDVVTRIAARIYRPLATEHSANQRALEHLPED
jgi:short-subunit dehydrogenase